MRCDSCDKKLIKIDRRTELAELDKDATDGQMADYFAAELSGDYGAWGIGIVEYRCPSCHRAFQFITDELTSYDPLIVSWQVKAKEGDFFSRFVFEYLAFVALLQNKLFIGAGSDRRTIQALKRDRAREEAYVATIGEYEPLRRLWQDVMAELGRTPLHNSSRDLDNPEIDVWWNNTGFEPKKDDKSPQGVVGADQVLTQMPGFRCPKLVPCETLQTLSMPEFDVGQSNVSAWVNLWLAATGQDHHRTKIPSRAAQTTGVKKPPIKRTAAFELLPI